MKELSLLSRASVCEVGQSQGERKPHLGEKEGRWKHEWVSGRKSFSGRYAESWFHSKPEMGKEIGRRRARI